MRYVVPAMVFVAGCGRLDFAAIDAQPPWSTPMPIPSTELSMDDEDCTMSSTTTEMIFVNGDEAELYTITRATPADAWSVAQPLSIDTGTGEGTPRLSPDDDTLYFESLRAGGQGMYDVWTATRAAPGQPWGTPVLVPDVNTAEIDKWLSPCTTGDYVMVRGETGEVEDLFEGTLGGGPPVAIAALNTPSDETSAYLTPDCLTLYFASDRGTSMDIYVTQRAAVGEPWDPPVAFAPFNDPNADDEDPWISTDGKTFVFASDRSGVPEIYLSTR